MPDLIFNFIFLSLGFFLLIYSGRWLVKSLIDIARFLRISEYLVSFVLMSFATTMPEFLVGLNSALTDSSELALGNALGSNLANLGLILGLTALLSGRVILSKKVASFDAWSTFILGISPLLLLIDGSLSRLDGLILITLFIMYLLHLIKGQHFFAGESTFWLSLKNHSDTAAKSLSNFIHHLIKFIISIFILLISAYVIVTNAEVIALKLGLSEIIIGVLLLAIGTSLPELTFAVYSAFSRHADLSLGNLIGATAFNSTWIIGLVALINPFALSATNESDFYITALMMVLVLFLANMFLRTKGYLGRREGLLLVSIYVFFVFFSLM